MWSQTKNNHSGWWRLITIVLSKTFLSLFPFNSFIASVSVGWELNTSNNLHFNGWSQWLSAQCCNGRAEIFNETQSTEKNCVIFAASIQLTHFHFDRHVFCFNIRQQKNKTWLENHGNGEYKRCCLHIETRKKKKQKPKPLTWINLLRISDWFGAIHDFRHPTHFVFKK